MLDKTYQPALIEGEVYRAWEEAGAFAAGRPDRASAAPFSIVIPPPNVTGSLHMGHALNNTLQDVLVRFERMRGRDVLWQPGTDHAGIATQMVVERQLAERGEPDRHSLGREAFIEQVWQWKEESGGKIIEQLKRLGASCDWSRLRFTMGDRDAPDDQMARAVRKAFVDLYNAGLIYKDKRLVNWDPKLLTAISDLEVEQVECTGSFKWTRDDEMPFDTAAFGRALAKNPNGHLYYFDYPVADADGHATREVLTVATTRPETMLGDTGVAVNPDDERYKDYVARYKADDPVNVILPLVGCPIPIVADEYSNPEKGSGAVKITPAHDFNDFEVGKRHGLLPMINIFDQQAKIALKGNTDFLSHMGAAPTFQSSESQDQNDLFDLNGLDRFEARTRVVEMMQARNLLAKIEPHTHTVPHGDRSGVVIEPYLTDQWYVDAATLAKPAIEAVRRGATSFVPKNWENTFFHWMETIQPWCISRQLWWGHQIPAWYGPKLPADSIQSMLDGPETFVAGSEAEAIEMARSKYGPIMDIRVLSFTPSCDQLGDVMEQVDRDIGSGKPRWMPIWRDEDVLDTWFSSGLWPFSTLGWPDETPELARYYPTSVLVTGFDIIFFWVARMMMLGMHFMEEVPFARVYIHALVRDETGAKMSKSKGNVIDPLELIDRYGADALRFTLAAMAAQGRDIKLSASRVEGYRNFATKLWNAARFAEMNGCAPVAGFDPASAEQTVNRWIAGESERAAASVTEALDEFRFNDAANAVYHFVWHVLCDWYLELAKPVLMGEDEAAKAETRAMTGFVLDRALKLLHPFMPFVTEELWGKRATGEAPRPSLLMLSPWPSRQGLENAAADAEIGWLIRLVSDIRSVRAEMNVPAAAKIPLLLSGANAETKARIARHKETIERLARLDGIAFGTIPKGAVQIVLDEAVLALPLAGIIDVEAESKRLRKEIDKVGSEISQIDAKLANEKFVSRAPEHVVEEQRERKSEAEAVAARLRQALQRLETVL
jgi:valyl-tRNA synthetase